MESFDVGGRERKGRAGSGRTRRGGWGGEGKFSKLLVIMSAISNGVGYRFADEAERKDSWN